MDEWSKLLAHSLEVRLSPDKFDKFVTLLSSRHPLPARRVADILLHPPPIADRADRSSSLSLDPKVPQYVQKLLLHSDADGDSDLLDLPSVLRGVLRYSSFRPPGARTVIGADVKAVDGASGSAEARKLRSRDALRWGKANYVQEETLMYGLAKAVSSGARPRSGQEAVDLIRALTEWMKVLVAAGVADDMMQQMGGAAETHAAETMAVMIAVGTLLVAASENLKVVGVLEKGCSKGRPLCFHSQLRYGEIVLDALGGGSLI
jgi:mediator of RNA polymerase II transcription subunit 5